MSLDPLQPSQSAASRHRVFLSRQFPPEVEARIEQRYDVVRNPEDRVLSDVELAAAAQGCVYLFVSATDHVTAHVFQALAPTLKAVATLSVGLNHLDLAAARDRGVAVFYSPGVLTKACAELAVFLLLGAARRGFEAESLMRSGRWKGFSPVHLLGIQLAGRRAGILGMGRIGQAVAQRLRAFELEIHYHNRNRLAPPEEGDATYHPTPESLAAVSDFLILAAPATTGLRGLVDRGFLSHLPPQAILVNISRGDVVNDDALIEALQSNRLFAAALDVFANEPDVDPRYRTLSNVFLTPHIASATFEARNAMGFILLDGLEAFEEGRASENKI